MIFPFRFYLVVCVHIKDAGIYLRSPYSIYIDVKSIPHTQYTDKPAERAHARTTNGISGIACISAIQLII